MICLEFQIKREVNPKLNKENKLCSVEKMMGCQRLQITSRLFSTSSNKCGYFKNMKQVVKNMKGAIVWEEDLDKRPSDLEIKNKDLPTNTPTLEHRIMRDQVHKFHVYDRKAGYHLGKYGNSFDYIDDDMTLKGLCFISRSKKTYTMTR